MSPVASDYKAASVKLAALTGAIPVKLQPPALTPHSFYPFQLRYCFFFLLSSILWCSSGGLNGRQRLSIPIFTQQSHLPLTHHSHPQTHHLSLLSTHRLYLAPHRVCYQSRTPLYKSRSTRALVGL